MGQTEIIELLKKEKKWLSTKEIQVKLEVSSASRPLSVLFKNKEINRREIKTGHKIGHKIGFQWRIK